MEAKTYREKREQALKLKKRGQELRARVDRLGELNTGFEKKIEAVEKEAKRLRALNVELSQILEEQILKQEHYADRVRILEAEVSRFERHYSDQRSRYLKSMQESDRLEAELEKLNAKKQALVKYSKRADGTQAALELRKKNIQDNLAQTDAQLKTIKPFVEHTKPAEQTLRDRVQRLGSNDVKSANALYHCLQTIISNIEEHEFEDVDYKTRINKNKTRIGARLYFTNLSSQYSDFCANLAPVISVLGKSFKSYGIEIATKAKKNASGVVESVDITVSLALGAQKRRQARL